MALALNDHKRFDRQKRVRRMMKYLQKQGFKAKNMIHEDVQRNKVYFEDCVKVYVRDGRKDGFVVKVIEGGVVVYPNEQFFQSMELIRTNDDGLMKILQDVMSGRKFA